MPKRSRDGDRTGRQSEGMDNTETKQESGADAVLTKRIQVDIPLAIFEVLSDLKKRTFASSYSDVFKNALRLYRWYVRVWEAKERIQVIKKDGSVKDVEMILL